MMTNRSKKGCLIYLFSLFIFTLLACSPKNTGEQKAQGEPTDGGIAASRETVPGSVAVQAGTASDNQRFTTYTGEAPASNFFEHLDFERPSYSAVKMWGWSKDGKVAYSDHVTLESDTLAVYILDIVDDKIVWQERLDFFSDPGPFGENYDQFNGKFYLDFIDGFKKICARNGIELVQTDFKKVPIRPTRTEPLSGVASMMRGSPLHNNQTVNIVLEKKATPLSSLERENRGISGGDYEGYTVIAENQGKQKVIREINFTRYADDVFICGYFLSPFEDRALIVIGEFAHSFEGSDITYHFAGCHLSTGFK